MAPLFHRCGQGCVCRRSMTGVKSRLLLVNLLWAAVSAQQPGVTVYGRFMSDQILPCTFLFGDDQLVYWYKNGKDNMVHRSFRGLDQLHDQLDQFKGRTSLFHDQLSRGNASLLLKKVLVSDGGRYTCYTSSLRGQGQWSIINLAVFAPVTEVSIVQEGENITCRSEGIYPEPQVTWSRNKMANTRIEPTEQQLYNIWSSVKVDDGGDYSCNVSNVMSSRRATLTTAKPRHHLIPLLVIAVVLLLLCFCLFLALVRRCLTPAPQRNEGEQRMEAPEILPLYNNEQIILKMNGNSEEMMNREGPGTTESEAVVHFWP